MGDGATAFPAVEQLLLKAVGNSFPAAVVHVRQAGCCVYEGAAGYLNPERAESRLDPDVLFDLASLTKLFTMSAFLRLVAGGIVELDAPVCSLLPGFRGLRPIQPYEDPLDPGTFVTITEADDGTRVDAGTVTFRHLLKHTSGLPAWRPLFRLPPEEIRETVTGTFFSYQPGARVIYSDLGLILLGWAIEAATGERLDRAIASQVVDPLGLHGITFGPLSPHRTVPTERCGWRRRRMHGEVHDENAWALDGIAGHAGLFGTAALVATFGQVWLDTVTGRRDDFLPRSLAQEAVSLQAQDGMLCRGLGWVLWSPSPESPGNPLSEAAFGHTGFTGTSLYVDPARDLVVACLTNHVYLGRERMGAISPFRGALHRAIVEGAAS